MGKKELHPSIIEFKKFVQSNPKIIQEVKKGKSTWQELYEEWYLLGEDDPRWDEVRDDDQQEDTSEQSTNDFMSKIMNKIAKMDPNQLHDYICSANQAISAILGVLSQFQGGTAQQHPKQQLPNHPFSFRKD